MKIIHPWNLVILAYITGLAFSIKAMLNKNASIKTKVIFYLSILGIGIFSYFQGRSHDACLIGVNYPAVLIGVIFLDKFISIKETSFKFISAIFLSFLIFLNLTRIPDFYLIYPALINKFQIILNKEPNHVSRNIDFINSKTSPGEKVFIISNHAGVYYISSHTICPIGMPSLVELLTKKDFEPIYQFLENNKDVKVFFDYNVVSLGDFFNPSKEQIIRILEKKYILTGLSPGRDVLLLMKKS